MQEQLIERMKTLRLRGMANALEESLTALSQKKLAPTRWLEQLLQAEIADRQARSYQYQLRLANFPMPRDLDSFDFIEDLKIAGGPLVCLLTGISLHGALADADGNHGQLVGAAGESDAVLRERRHQIGEVGRVVVWTDAAVDELVGFLFVPGIGDQDALRREKRRRGRARGPRAGPVRCSPLAGCRCHRAPGAAG